ncbi:onserved alanine and valine rich protein [Mycobacteroides abscessus subsp. abscessus]|nr:onserved alanine and valine rich protein [Mycobacteroides abscessus subsp. abscessus]
MLAVADTRSAVYLPGTRNELVVFDDRGMRVGATVLPGEISPTNAAAQAGDVITWWTGSQVLVLSASDLSYRFVLPTTTKPLGPGTNMAGELLIPVEGGIDVFNMTTGEFRKNIVVQRNTADEKSPEFRKSIVVQRNTADEKSPVISAVVGNTLVEQRGSRIFALG